MLVRVQRENPEQPADARELDGGRRRWAHLAVTRINIGLTILPKKFEELMNVKGVGEKSFLKIKDRLTVVAPRAEKTSTSASA